MEKIIRDLQKELNYRIKFAKDKAQKAEEQNFNRRKK